MLPLTKELKQCIVTQYNIFFNSSQGGTSMLQEKKKTGKILLALLGLVVIFLIVVGVKDFMPAQTPVEKTVVYGQQ